MLFSVFLSYLPYTIVTAFTPGPNNIIALHAVGQGGWRAGKNVLWGIAAGFLCVMIFLFIGFRIINRMNTDDILFHTVSAIHRLKVRSIGLQDHHCIS